jgi:DNA-binding HxlR family transcriptional regulator
MRWSELGDEQCPIARFLSVLGDRWALLILNDSFLGVRRFETFKARLGISRTTLTQRLADLCDAGILERVAYRHRPTRFEYRLTWKGLDLHPVMMAMARWSNQYQADEGGPPLLYEHTRCSSDFTPVIGCSECGEAVPAWEVRVRTRPPMPHLPPVSRGPIEDGSD